MGNFEAKKGAGGGGIVIENFQLRDENNRRDMPLKTGK